VFFIFVLLKNVMIGSNCILSDLVENYYTLV